MKMLAIELSTAQGSLALFDDDRILAAKEWNENAFRNQHIFVALPELFREAGESLDAVDCFMVGRGPGNFSGLRIGISAARGFALPDQKEVYAVSSGEALALSVCAGGSAGSVAVVGDARRNMLWFCLFSYQGSELKKVGDWEIAAYDEAAERIGDAQVVVSPDWERLKDRLAGGLAKLSWLEENRFPSAVDIGHLGTLKRASGLPSEELGPLYMHPPVFIPPRFPAQ
ncbi:MAG: tRNA (adenosine(37)-N6)-threonylcarbamoyltransferase complex dimerization subunit type 1 TsaB [Verrucomicrobia bacterium]|nr:tRNA (adenosine(37)-N6)-threonylcarbamoyltransferase complex dimerization subunit type 1 TsaB [Verrucomicrobiota bacterium]